MEITRFTPYYLSLFYFIFFAWMGIQIPYFNLYLYHTGLSLFEIGIITAAIPLVRVFSPALWGYIADRHDTRGITGTILWLLSTLTFTVLLFTGSFGYILAVVTIFTFFWAPTLPIAEASAMVTARQEGIDYGRMRVWGTIGFISLSWLMGVVLDYAPIETVLWGLILLLLGNTFISRHIPMNRGSGSNIRLGTVISQLRSRPVVVFMTVAMLMIFSHSTYYGFFSIYLESLGYSKTLIGLLWGLGAVGEVVVMFFSGALIRRFGTKPIIAFSLMMAVIRWAIFASTDRFLLFILAQGLHSFTFGTFHIASIKHVEELFPDNMKNTAQALYSSSSYGTGLVLGTILSGLLYDRIGAPALFMISSAAAMIALAVLSLEGPSLRESVSVSA